MGIHGVEGVVEFEVSVKRIVFGFALLLGDAVVERCGDLHLIREELTQFEVGSQCISLVVVGAALADAFLKATEALGDDASRQGDVADVGQLDVQITRCCPTAIVVDFLQAQLVDPHLAGLDFARQVAHTNHHGLDLAE